jgi:glycine/D-amino acid oxidase-like deaminating enzyme
MSMGLPQRAEVVIVGGGIFGCATALHLVERGIEDVLLLERDGLAQATSHAGGGFVGRWGGGYVPAWGAQELALEAYGIDFYHSLAEDHGLEFGYKRNGSLWAATTQEAWDKHLEVIATHPGVENKQTLTSADVEDVTGGVILASGVVGGVLHPDGCQVQAPRATAAIARRVEAAGGQIRTRTPVTGLAVGGGRIHGVETAEGTVAAGSVVLAAGAWTNVLLRPIGAWMPMVPLIATRIITEPLGVSPAMPTLMLPEFCGLWIREELGGLLWGAGYDVDPRRLFIDQDPPERFDHLPLDGFLETERIGAEAAPAIPLLTRYRSPRVAQGAPTYTPDLRGIVCGVRGTDGLWVVGGDNEAGITHGPGYARLLADLVCDGTSSFVDPAEFSDERYGDRYSTPSAVGQWAAQPLLRPEEDGPKAA